MLLTLEGNFATLSAMTRQWRIEFEGAYYHILLRGNERKNIFNNHEIGNLFGLGYSSISRRVTLMKSKISKEDVINKRLEEIKSLITNQGVTPYSLLFPYSPFRNLSKQRKD
jgi:hypothetical protein